MKVGGTLRLTCRVYLGNAGPDDTYAKTAVIHWFHDQRLLDPDLENWKSYRNALPKKVNSRRVITQTLTKSDQQFKVCIKCNTSLILLSIIWMCVRSCLLLTKVLILQGRKSGSRSERRQRLNRHRLLTKTEVKDNGLLGILEVRRITPYDAGNYSCVPSYALPDWAQVHVMHGMTNLVLLS